MPSLLHGGLREAGTEVGLDGGGQGRSVGGDGVFWGITWVAANAPVPRRVGPSATGLAGERKVGAREQRWAPSLGEGILKDTKTVVLADSRKTTAQQET